MIYPKINSELPNQRFSNAVDWEKVGDTAKTIKDKLLPSGKKDEVVVLKPEPISETKILGMHPMTLMIVSLSVIALSITGIVIYKKFNK